jgi:damage-control phosphatase, subfamily I
MKTYLDCIPCFVRQAFETAKMVTDDKTIQREILKQTLEIVDNLEAYENSPQMAQHVYKIIRQLTNNDDPFKDIKKRFNDFAMQLYQPMKKKIADSKHPFETAVRLSIAGNIIDFGIKSALNFSDVEKTIELCLSEPLDKENIEHLAKAVKSAKNILYLGDNAGEIVFDKLFIEQLGPEKVTFAVRGGPIINDITMADARIVGLTNIVKVIDNGDDSPGTILKRCSNNFKEHFQSADMIIAKGQGNYETLSEIKHNIFFILKAKCAAIARHLNCQIGQSVIRRIA